MRKNAMELYRKFVSVWQVRLIAGFACTLIGWCCRTVNEIFVLMIGLSWFFIISIVWQMIAQIRDSVVHDAGGNVWLKRWQSPGTEQWAYHFTWTAVGIMSLLTIYFWLYTIFLGAGVYLLLGIISLVATIITLATLVTVFSGEPPFESG